MRDSIKLSKEEMQKLLGGDFNRLLKKVEKDVVNHAKKLTDKKLSSIKVVDAGLSLDDNSLFIHVQGKWPGGALNYMVRWQVKASPGKAKFVEDVGNIP